VIGSILKSSALAFTPSIIYSSVDLYIAMSAQISVRGRANVYSIYNVDVWASTLITEPHKGGTNYVTPLRSRPFGPKIWLDFGEKIGISSQSRGRQISPRQDNEGVIGNDKYSYKIFLRHSLMRVTVEAGNVSTALSGHTAMNRRGSGFQANVLHV